MQSYKIVENEVTTEGVVNLVVVGAWYLRIKCKWGQKRVCQYIEGVIRYIGVVYNRERDIDKLTEELKDECDFDYQSLMADFKPLTLKTDTVDEDGMKMIIYKMQTILPVALYPLYMQFGWRKKRMADIGQTAKFVLMDMMNGRIKTIKDTIRLSLIHI